MAGNGDCGNYHQENGGWAAIGREPGCNCIGGCRGSYKAMNQLETSVASVEVKDIFNVVLVQVPRAAYSRNKE